MGLPDAAIKESQDRIISAIESCGYKFPGKRIVINMSPADLRKEGAAYDLPLAIGLLAADGQIPADLLDRYLIMGELSLDGSVRAIRGSLPIAIQARSEGFEGFILPAPNAREAAVVNQLKVYSARSLREVIDMLSGQSLLPQVEVDTRGEPDFGSKAGVEAQADFRFGGDAYYLIDATCEVSAYFDTGMDFSLSLSGEDACNESEGGEK